jgi:phage terminase small subunit
MPKDRINAMRETTTRRRSTGGLCLNGGERVGKEIAALADPREQRFVVEYAKSGNGKQSAVVAGYSVRSAHTLASRLLKKVYIREAIERRNAEIMSELNFTPDRILKEFGRIAAADVELKGNDKVKALTELAKLARMYPGDRLELSGTVEHQHAHKIDIEALEGADREKLREVLTALKAKQIEAETPQEAG